MKKKTSHPPKKKVKLGLRPLYKRPCSWIIFSEIQKDFSFYIFSVILMGVRILHRKGDCIS